MITLTAAGGYKFLDAWKDGEIVGASGLDLALGFIAAAVSAFIVVKWLLRFVQSHTFNGFAIYRLILGAALLLWAAKQ
jgi:undecaprenyl-diphosphatase